MFVNLIYVVYVLEDDFVDIEGMVLLVYVYSCGVYEMEIVFVCFKWLFEQRFDGYMCIWVVLFCGDYGCDFWQIELMDGWKVIDILMLLYDQFDYDVEKQFYFELVKEYGFDLQVEFMICNVGMMCVYFMEDVIFLEEWQDYWMREYIQCQGSCDCLVGVFNFGLFFESIFIIDCLLGFEFFMWEDVEMFYVLFVEFLCLYYWFMLECGIVVFVEWLFLLKECQVMQGFLLKSMEVEFVDEFEFSKGVLYNYVIVIYWNYGVGLCYELLQLWFVELEDLLGGVGGQGMLIEVEVGVWIQV